MQAVDRRRFPGSCRGSTSRTPQHPPALSVGSSERRRQVWLSGDRRFHTRHRARPQPREPRRGRPSRVPAGSVARRKATLGCGDGRCIGASRPRRARSSRRLMRMRTIDSAAFLGGLCLVADGSCESDSRPPRVQGPSVLFDRRTAFASGGTGRPSRSTGDHGKTRRHSQEPVEHRRQCCPSRPLHVAKPLNSSGTPAR